MNLLRDLKKEFQEKKKQESMTAQLRKRSKDSIARPKAEKNITSKDPRLQGI
jgi:spore coat polysaccharide biosynthesis protein SpsF (cytidylyltransferase family)